MELFSSINIPGKVPPLFLMAKICVRANTPSQTANGWQEKMALARQVLSYILIRFITGRTVMKGETTQEKKCMCV